jgi:tetratricopeptide (TPR) repeat protein
MSNRREKIEAMLVEEPNDLFLRYSLAMEFDKEGEHEASLAGLGQLCQESPPYIAAFFMAGKQLARLGRIEEAREFLRNGIEVARLQGDRHAASEMGDFLASLGGLGE